MKTVLARRICKDNGWEFGAVFRWQFILNKQRAAPDDAWKSAAFGSFWLHHCPDLRRIALIGSGGEKLGFLLGLAIDTEGQMITDKTHELADTDADAIERWIENLAGRFIVFIDSADGPCAYSDPTCGLSAMYSNELQTVTSNLSLALDRPIAPPSHLDSETVKNGSNRFFMGETADRAFTQMRANHKLSLVHFNEERHWPNDTPGHDFQPGDEIELGASIASRLQDIMAALVRNFDCALPLTAGKDSRLLFGAALPKLEQLGSIYSMGINRLTYMDCRVARNIAWDYGVPHQAIVKNSPGFSRGLSDDALATLREQMGLRTSYVFNGRDNDYTRGLMLAPQSDLTLRGGLCEITRANKYRRPLPDDSLDRDYAFSNLLEMSLDDAAREFHPERLSSLRNKYEAWANGAPDALQSRLVDLAHCELWMPCIVNPQYYAFANSFFMNPFNDRKLIELAMRVPPHLRKKDALIHAILKACDPNLGGFPFLHAYIRLIDEARERGVNPLKL